MTNKLSWCTGEGGIMTRSSGSRILRAYTKPELTKAGVRIFEVFEVNTADITIMPDEHKANLLAQGYETYFLSLLRMQRDATMEFANLEFRWSPVLGMAKKQCEIFANELSSFAQYDSKSTRNVIDMEPRVFLMAALVQSECHILSANARQILERIDALGEEMKQLGAIAADLHDNPHMATVERVASLMIDAAV